MMRCTKITVSAVTFAAVMICSLPAMAMDVEAVREYVRATGFRQNVEHGLKGIGQGEIGQKIIEGLDIKAVENAYVDALAKRLTDTEFIALQQAAGIPHLQEALKKQNKAVLDCTSLITKQLEASAAKNGIKLPGLKTGNR
jgi:hypothetical protein